MTEIKWLVRLGKKLQQAWLANSAQTSRDHQYSLNRLQLRQDDVQTAWRLVEKARGGNLTSVRPQLQAQLLRRVQDVCDAAIASLLSGEHANEAMMSQIEAADQWSYYQSKSIKAAVLDAKTAFTGASDGEDQSKRVRYEKEQEEIKSEAEQKQAAAKSYFHKHEVFARGVTMFQIAIAIAAISALTRKRSFWVVSLVFGVFGCAFLVLAATAR